MRESSSWVHTPLGHGPMGTRTHVPFWTFGASLSIQDRSTFPWIISQCYVFVLAVTRFAGIIFIWDLHSGGRHFGGLPSGGLHSGATSFAFGRPFHLWRYIIISILCGSTFWAVTFWEKETARQHAVIELHRLFYVANMFKQIELCPFDDVIRKKSKSGARIS